MHSPQDGSSLHSLEHCCDAVLDAFVDSFVVPLDGPEEMDRWLRRLIGELEGARDDLQLSLKYVGGRRYAGNLARCIKRVENVLAQLYEEQLHH